MASLKELKKLGVIPLMGATLAAYYIFVYHPLQRRAESLNAPLDKSWQELAASLEQPRGQPVDFLNITNQLVETRQALNLLVQARQKTASFLEVSPALRDLMSEPFQLVEYQIARSAEAEDLARLAKERKVTVDPPVFNGFPEHTADVRQQELLWASLAMIDSIMRTAIHCDVVAIHSLQSPVVLTNDPAIGLGRNWAEIPVQLEFSARAENVLKMLHLLPLRPGEARAAGYANVSTNKAPLFIDRLVVRKQDPNKPDEVRVLVRAAGFVLQEY